MRPQLPAPARPLARGRPTAAADAALIEVVHTLDAADEVCPQCGGQLTVWADQYEEADEIDVVERWNEVDMVVEAADRSFGRISRRLFSIGPGPRVAPHTRAR